jgi:hypothetical protein
LKPSQPFFRKETAQLVANVTSWRYFMTEANNRYISPDGIRQGKGSCGTNFNISTPYQSAMRDWQSSGICVLTLRQAGFV